MCCSFGGVVAVMAVMAGWLDHLEMKKSLIYFSLELFDDCYGLQLHAHGSLSAAILKMGYL